ncbi:MAG: YdhR family protein [Pseudomonadota bacterium]
MTDTSTTFLYAEFQVSAPFEESIWEDANSAMKTVPGLLNKTWLSGLSTKSIGGFYEFDSEAHARAYAEGMLADFARNAGGSLTVKLFDGASVAVASRQMNSPFYRV